MVGVTDFGTAFVGCTCTELVKEIDAYYCKGCGDICCEDCLTDCMHCGNVYCLNCSENRLECIRCYQDTLVRNEGAKAYIVMKTSKGFERLPVRNSSYFLTKTSDYVYPSNLKLEIKGTLYDFKYRSICMRDDGSKQYDYIYYFHESEEQIINVNGKRVIV